MENSYLRQVTTTMFVLLLTMLGMPNTFAQEFTVGKVKYSIIDGNSVSVIGHVDGQNAKGELVIPNPVSYNRNTYSVTSIGAGAFAGCAGLTNVTISNSVITIAVQAFESCMGLTNITIPNSVTSIGVLAFQNCWGLTNVTIPNSVTSIGDGAFSGCRGLTNVTIPNSVTSIDGSFNGCSGLESIIVDSENKVYDSRKNCNAIIETSTNTLILGCKNTIIPQSVTSIGDHAFMGCSGLTSITIPSSVISIGSQAFWFCTKLTSVIIKSDRIQDMPFYELFFGCDSLDETGVVYKISTNGGKETKRSK